MELVLFIRAVWISSRLDLNTLRTASVWLLPTSDRTATSWTHPVRRPEHNYFHTRECSLYPHLSSVKHGIFTSWKYHFKNGQIGHNLLGFSIVRLLTFSSELLLCAAKRKRVIKDLLSSVHSSKVQVLLYSALLGGCCPHSPSTTLWHSWKQQRCRSDLTFIK